MLDAAQQAVVNCNNHCLCVAGPGSGKTRTLVSKIGHIAQDPRAIIRAVTFTRMAAEELKERIAHEWGIEVARRVSVGTFHKFAIEQLRAENRLGKLVSSSEQRIYILRAADASGFDATLEDPAAALERMKTNVTGAYDHDEFLQAYQKLLAGARCNDLWDVMRDAVMGMKNGNVRISAITHLLVDESQDCDDLQYEWAVCHTRQGAITTLVGDDDQTIYGFRRAMGYAGMTRFKQEFGADEIHLSVNYRCRKEILDQADMLIRHNQGRIQKNLYSSKGPGGSFTMLRVSDAEAEGDLLVDYAQRLGVELPDEMGGGWAVKRGSFAIIARNNLALFKMILRARAEKIRYSYERKVALPEEIGVFLLLLRCLDQKHISAIVAGLAYVGVPTKFAKQFVDQYPQQAMEIFDGKAHRIPAIDDVVDARVRGLGQKMAAATNYYAMGEIDFAIEIVEGAVQEYALDSTNQVIVDTLPYLASVIKKLKGRLSTRAMLIETDGDSGNDLKGFGTDKEYGPVDFHTMHSCKGLEYDYVILAGCVQGTIPSKKSTDVEEERRLMYVGITRAKEHCIISAPQPEEVSTFMKELKGGTLLYHGHQRN